MLGFGGFSGWHILVVGIVALLLFGNRLPEIARSLGRSLNEFKRGMREVGEDVDRIDEEAEEKEEKPRLRQPPASTRVPREPTEPVSTSTDSEQRD